MKHIMAVYDVDPLYAARFAEVVNQKEKIPFEVVAFSSLERLKRFGEETPIEILLISSAVSRAEADSVGAQKCIVLTDGETAETEAEYPGVYKYQSSDNIVREVMAKYCERSVAVPGLSIKPKVRIWGIYSPINRCLKTSFAITMGKLLSQDVKTLYVNLEEFSGLSVLTHTEYRTDLSDLLYFYCSGSYNLLRLNSVVHSLDGLDYIPPVRYPEDLDQAGPKKLSELIRTIAEESSYEMVLVDMGSCRQAAAEIMGLCQVIYMPIKEDSVSLAKLEEFETYLERLGKEDVKERIRRLKLPYHSSFGRKENYLEQLVWGELGDYTRNLLRGELRK